MDGKAFTPTDAIALQNSGYGRGYDGFGMDGGWFFWIIIILFFFCGNGWNNNNNGMQDNFISSEFIKRDIFNTNQNVSNTGTATQLEVLNAKYDNALQTLENRYTNQLGLQNLGSEMQECCCGINRNIDSVRYDSLLTAKDAQMQLSDCCCRLEAAGLKNTQAILDALCADKIDALRTDLQSAQLQISQLSQTNTLLGQINKVPQPTYLTCSPYMSSYYAYNGFNNGYNNGCGCGCGNNLI